VVYTIRALIGSADCQTGPDARGRWSRAVPLPCYGGHLAGAWAVLTGKAVAVRYPVSGELEQALQDTGGIRVDEAQEPAQ
jgi:hypothetical protein